MSVVTVHVAKTNLSKLLARVEAPGADRLLFGEIVVPSILLLKAENRLYCQSDEERIRPRQGRRRARKRGIRKNDLNRSQRFEKSRFRKVKESK
jgi:hypothetical protein